MTGTNDKAAKAGPSTQLEGRVGHGKEKVGEKRRLGAACDAGVEGAKKGLHGEGGWTGGEKLSNKRKKEAEHMRSGCEGKGKEEAVDKSSRKEGLEQLTSTLLWDLRNEAGRDKKLTPALDQRVDQLEQKLLAKYCTQEAGFYADNLKYKQAFQGLAREVVDARKCIREEQQEQQDAVDEEETRDTMSLDAHDLEPVSSSSSRVFFHVPIHIYGSRQPSHSTPRPFPSASTAFPAQQAEVSEAHVEVEKVEEDVKQEVEDDVKLEVEEDMQQHITSVLCKGRADGGIWGEAGGEAQEKECKVKKNRDTSDEGCQERGKGAGAADPKHEQTEMRNKELRRDCEARNLSREERKMMIIMRQIEEMEQKEKAVKAAPWSTQLEGRVGHGNEKVGEKRRFREACDTGACETVSAQGPRGGGGGAGGEKLSNKAKKEAKHNRGGLEGKGKEKAVEKRKCPVSEADSRARKQQRGEEVGGEGAGGGAVKNKRAIAKCPHNRRRSQCKQCGGASICEHNRQRSRCKQCGGASICEHNRERHQCKQCGGASICEHNRRRNECLPCGGASICEHNRQRSRCKQCGGASICEHNRRKSDCKQCGGASICEHNRQMKSCKDCGGASICEHNRRRTVCKQCGGGSLCEHNRERGKCKQCGGSSICEHNSIKSSCRKCGGASICEHNRRRTVCKQCGGASICEHNRQRSQCKDCGGSSICEHDRRRSRCKQCSAETMRR